MIKRLAKGLLFGLLAFSVFRAYTLFKAGKSMSDSLAGAALLPIQLASSLFSIFLGFPTKWMQFFQTTINALLLVLEHPFDFTANNIVFGKYTDSLLAIGNGAYEKPAGDKVVQTDVPTEVPQESANTQYEGKA